MFGRVRLPPNRNQGSAGASPSRTTWTLTFSLISGIYLISLLTFVQLAGAQERITGPWLWMIAHTPFQDGVAGALDIDSLATASGGKITEEMVAQNGAEAGDTVGNRVWTPGEISAIGGNNITDTVTQIGLGAGDIDRHSAYALITIISPRDRHNVTMRVGSDDAIKVWLNGEVVWKNPVVRPAGGFLDEFRVNLKAGENLLLVKVTERDRDWSMFVGLQATFTAAGKTYEPSAKPGKKITGPWVWMIVPSPECGDAGIDIDWLAEVSQGRSTEERIARNGAKAREKAGKLAWTKGEITPTGKNNVNEVINEMKLAFHDINNHFAYAYLNVVSPSARSTRMFAGSDDAIKIWLNGEVVWKNPVIRFAEDFQEDFPIRLKKGDNPLLVKVGECRSNWSMFVGFSQDDRDLKFNTDLPAQAVEPSDKFVTRWVQMKTRR